MSDLNLTGEEGIEAGEEEERKGRLPAQVEAHAHGLGAPRGRLRLHFCFHRFLAKVFQILDNLMSLDTHLDDVISSSLGLKC